MDTSEFHRQYFRPVYDLELAKALFKDSVVNVSLETFSLCNRLCWFCPNSFIDRRSANMFMPNAVFDAIIGDLAAIGYKHNFHLTRYSEPLADRSTLERIRAIRDAMPATSIVITTNGDYLNAAYLDELLASGLTSLSVSVYLGNTAPYDHGKIHQRIRDMLSDLCLTDVVPITETLGIEVAYAGMHKTLKIEFWGRNFDRLGNDRGGSIKLSNAGNVRQSPCFEPTQSFTIDYDGSVVPCCNLRSDVPEHKDYVCGKIEKSGDIFLVYTNKMLADWRRHLVNFSDKMDPCRTCNFKEYSGEPSFVSRLNEIAKNLLR